jgi:hypothetical protein
MVEHLKRWAVLIAIAAMAWAAWAGVRQDAEKQVQRDAMPVIPLASLPLRNATEAAFSLGDPCKLEARAAVVPKPASKPAQPASSSTPVHESEAARSLSLDSILAFPGGAQAYICGQTIMVGEPIHGVDMENPPVLAWIDGVRVGVRYKNREYILDLDHDRKVSLESRSSSAAVQAAARRAASDPDAATLDAVPAESRAPSGDAPDSRAQGSAPKKEKKP